MDVLAKTGVEGFALTALGTLFTKLQIGQYDLLQAVFRNKKAVEFLQATLENADTVKKDEVKAADSKLKERGFDGYLSIVNFAYQLKPAERQALLQMIKENPVKDVPKLIDDIKKEYVYTS